MVKKTQNEGKALFCVFIFKRFWGDSGERGGGRGREEGTLEWGSNFFWLFRFPESKKV